MTTSDRSGPTALPLPPVPRPFLGREREVKVLAGLTRAHRMVAVEGPAGSGKTALLASLGAALARSHRALRYVPLAGLTSEEDFWSRLLTDLGHAVRPGMAGRLLTRRVLEVVESGSVTLLFDDLEAMPRAVAVTVLPDLLAGLRLGRAVLASRETLPLPEALAAQIPHLAVRGLAPEAGAELLAACVAGRPAARPARTRLARIAGGLPLALRLLAAHPALGEKLVAAEVVTPEADLDADVVRPLLDELPRASLELLALVSVAGGRLANRLAGLLALDGAALSALAASGFLTEEKDGWTVHPAVAESVLARLDKPATRDLERRLAAAFLAAWEARPAAVHWLLGAVRHFFRVGDHTAVAKLLGRSRGLYVTRGLTRDYLASLSALAPTVTERFPRLELDRAHLAARFLGPNAISRTLLTRLVESSDSSVVAAALAELAEIDLLDGDLTLALTRAEEALKLTRRHGTEPERARGLVRLGRLRSEARQWARAQECYGEAIARLRLDGDRALLTDALLGSGQCLAEQGHHGAALASFVDALKLQRQLPPDDELTRAEAMDRPLSSRNLRAETGLRVGLFHRDRGQYKESLAALARAEREFRRAGDLRAAAETAVSAGEVLLAMGRHNRARLVLEQGLLDLKEAGSTRGVAVAQRDIGLLALESGDLKGAGTALAEALAGFSAVRDERGVRAVQIAQATLMRLSANRAGARVLLEGLLIEARRDRRTAEEAEILYRLASQALEEGDLDEARRRGDEAAEVFEAQAHHKGRERVRGLLIRVAFLAGELERAGKLAQAEVESAREREEPRGLAMALTQLAEIRLDSRRNKDALELAKEAMALRSRCGDERGVVASHRLLAEVHLQSGALPEARRVAARGLEMARSRGMAAEQAHLHLLLGAFSLRAGRTADARAHADQVTARAIGLLDLQLLGLKLAQAAALTAGDRETAKRLADTWFARMEALPLARVRTMFGRMARLGLDTSRRCVVRTEGDVQTTTLDHAALIDLPALDVAVDTVRRRVRLKGSPWIDMTDRPSLLALLASTIRRTERRASLAVLAREVLGIGGRVGAGEVAAAVQELSQRLVLHGRPVLALTKDRAEVARGLKVGLLEEG